MLIPSHTPHGKPIHAVGVHCSGGADSSILLYQVTQEAARRNIRVYAMTVRRPRPTNPIYAAQVVDFISDALCYDIEHIVYYPPLDTYEEREYANESFMADQNLLNFSDGLYQLSFSGLTTTPPLSVQATFVDRHSGVEHKRGDTVEKDTERFMTMEEAITFTERHVGHPYRLNSPLDLCQYVWSKRPYYNFNKKHIADIYHQENLMDTLFPLTRSCESEDIYTAHCGTCWWCEERKWAFGTC